MEIIKTCIKCTTEFIAKSNRAKYCSDKCKYGICVCENCKKNFIKVKHTQGKFCSTNCWYKWQQNQENKEKICSKCKLSKKNDQFIEGRKNLICKDCFDLIIKNSHNVIITENNLEKIVSKKCEKCEQIKNILEFPLSGYKNEEISIWCKKCHENRYVKTKNENRLQELQNTILFNLSKKIKEERIKKNWTQQELAEKLGVKHSQVRSWEKEKSFPRQNRLRKIFELFNWEIPIELKENKKGKIPIKIEKCAYKECNKEFPVYKKGTIFCSRKCSNIGENNPCWKGGKTCTSGGYIMFKKPEHPFADSRGYIAEHRLVMEEILGRFLEPHERIHHKNGIRNNNKKENLELWKQAKDPTGIRAVDYHCAGCCCYDLNKIKILNLEKKDEIKIKINNKIENLKNLLNFI